MTVDLTNNPKVLVVDLSIRYGGSTSRILSLLRKAKSSQVGLAVVESSAVSKEAEKFAIPVHYVGKHRLDVKIPQNIRKTIQQEGYQVVDTQNIQSKFWASLAIKKTNAALVSTLNSWYANEHGKFSIKGKIYTLLELATNSNLSVCITVSENDRKSAIAANIPNEKVELIYNAIETNIQKIQSDKAWLVSKFSLPSNKVICTAVGRLVAIKGHDVLIKSIELIKKANENFHILIVGEGKFRQELEQLIQSANVQNFVTLAGYQDRETALAIINASDIFMMPSRYEGTPVALLEAASLGVPIIASQVGGIPELVTHQQEALLVPPENPSELASAILQLINDKKLASRLATNAKDKAQTQFSLEKQFELTWAAYRKAYALAQK
ncbi:MAG: glycosyltransferase family 4 protein [Anaerolineales bacterium]|nr:glycosyltransferase family 4 protein [Anaerolineales bacterium]